MRPNLDCELFICGKKCYAIDKGEIVEVLIDCDVWCGIAHLVIPMTPEQFVEWQARSRRTCGRLIQEIFPTMKSEVREALVTGMTPAEWKARLEDEEYEIPQLLDLGYKFEEDFLQTNANTDAKNKTE